MASSCTPRDPMRAMEAQKQEPWDPVAEGLCGECGGEGVTTDLQWTPWGIIPVVRECRGCRKCSGDGKCETSDVGES